MKKFFFVPGGVMLFLINQAQDITLKDIRVVGARQVKSLDSNGWKKNGTFILNMNQGALSNWVAGGEQSVLGINAILNYSVNFRFGRSTWDNYFDLALGFQNATSFGKFRKIDDRIDVTSKYGYQLNHNWYIGVLSNFNSQSLAGYDYSVEPSKKISNFLTPGKILLSPGIDHKTAIRFSLFISPVTIRWVLKKDDDFFYLAKFGVDSARRSNTEYGAFVTGKFKAAFTRWVVYAGRVDLFSNYKRHPENIDVLMNNLLTLKFNKTFATNLSLDLIYDDDQKKRIQLKEILGLGLTLKI